MCTSIIENRTRGGHGEARGQNGFPAIPQTVVAYDHARHAPLGDVTSRSTSSTRTSTLVRGRGSS